METSLSVMSFSREKFGNRGEENEDAVVENDLLYKNTNEKMISLCVADGATESIFSRRWARKLVDAVETKQIRAESFLNDLGILQNEWEEWLGNMELAWYAEEKAKQGTYAAFLLVDFNLEKRIWNALSVGDCCVFQVRKNKLIASFPYKSENEFNNSPNLIGTKINSKISVLNENGVYLEGDIFYLISDSLAKYILSEFKNGYDKISEFLSYIKENKNEEYWLDFRDVTEYWIKSGRVKNDDCSLIIINL
jgi:hypothetical protein